VGSELLGVDAIFLDTGLSFLRFEEGDSMVAGIWTVRGRSFPFETIFGVAIVRERLIPFCASIRCKASSG